MPNSGTGVSFSSFPHLVLVKLPLVIPKLGVDIVPIFHDWMNNMDAVYGAAQFLEFVDRNVESTYIPFASKQNVDNVDRIPEIIKGCYDVDFSRGFFNKEAVRIESKGAVLDPESVDPRYGVTFIDLRQAENLGSKYCFFYADNNPDHLQKTPMNAREFIEDEFTAAKLEKLTLRQRVAYNTAVDALEKRMSSYKQMSVKELCNAYPEYMLTE